MVAIVLLAAYQFLVDSIVQSSRSTAGYVGRVEAFADLVYVIPPFVLIPALGISTIRNPSSTRTQVVTAWLILGLFTATTIFAMSMWGG